MHGMAWHGMPRRKWLKQYRALHALHADRDKNPAAAICSGNDYNSNSTAVILLFDCNSTESKSSRNLIEVES